MRTSTIRHPKFERSLVAYEWQVTACKGNKLAANLLSFFEYKFNQSIDVNKENKWWMCISDSEIEEAMMLPSKKDLDTAIGLLESLKFVSYKAPRDIVDKISKPKSRLVFFNAKKINEYIDHYQKEKYKEPSNNISISSSDVVSCLALVLMSHNLNLFSQEVVLSTRFTPEQIRQCFKIVDFWKAVLKHPRANIGIKLRRHILQRLENGFKFEECLMAVIGLTFSSWHMGQNGTKYDGITHIFGDEDKTIRYINLAKDNGWTEEACVDHYRELIGCDEFVLPKSNNIERESLPDFAKPLFEKYAEMFTTLQPKDKIISEIKSDSEIYGIQWHQNVFSDLIVEETKKRSHLDPNAEKEIRETIRSIEWK